MTSTPREAVKTTPDIESSNGPIEDATVGDILRRAAQECPQGKALVEGLASDQPRREWTYAQLLADAETTARAMLDIAQPGENVAIWANNVPEWILVQMGAALAGLTLVTVNPALRAEEVLHILRNSGAAVVFHVDEYRGADLARCLETLAPQLSALRSTISFSQWPLFCARETADTRLPRVAPDDVVQIQYTSGTTGLPKGVRLRHRGIVNNSRTAFADRLPAVHDAPIVNAMPLFHTAGSSMLTLGAIQTRSTHVLMPTFDPGAQLRLIESERSAIFGGVSTMLRAMLDHPDFDRTDLSSVKVAVSGGAMVDPQLAREVEARVGVPLVISYGQTECSPGITMTHPEDPEHVRTTTVGRALPAVEVRIVDAEDNTRGAALGEIGEVCTRGYHVMIGYQGDPKGTAEAIDDDGWLHTGDLGTMDADGNLRLVGRIKDMIIRGGENIYPAEVENALLDHESVAQVAVVGAHDAHWGEEVAAFVRVHVGANVTAEQLHSFLKPRLARHKVPRLWYLVDEFPLNSSGKILKTELREKTQRDGAWCPPGRPR